MVTLCQRAKNTRHHYHIADPADAGNPRVDGSTGSWLSVAMVTCEIIWSEPVCPSTQVSVDSFHNYTSFKIIGLESVVMSWIAAGIVLLLWVYGTMAGLVWKWDSVLELVCTSAVEGNTYKQAYLMSECIQSSQTNTPIQLECGKCGSTQIRILYSGSQRWLVV